MEAEGVVDVGSRAPSSLRNRRKDFQGKRTGKCEDEFNNHERLGHRSLQTILYKKELSPKSEKEEEDISACSGEHQENDTTDKYLECASPINDIDLKEGSSITVACPNQNKGCKWMGQPEDREQHLNKLPYSNEGTVEDCEGEIEGCGYQTIHCPECKEEIMYISRSTHLEGASHQVVPCEYTGCDFECPRYQMQQHKEAEIQKHLDLLHTISRQERDKLIYKNIIAFCVLFLIFAIILTLLLPLNKYDESFVKYVNTIENHEKKINEQEGFISSTAAEMKRNDAFHDHMCRINGHKLQNMAAVSKKHRLELATLHDHLDKLDQSLYEVDSKLSSQMRLAKDIDVRLDLLQHDVKKDLDPDLRDAKEEILQMKETLQGVQVTLNGLKYDITELKNGFSKKYIDNTVRRAMCSLLPKSISGC